LISTTYDEGKGREGKGKIRIGDATKHRIYPVAVNVHDGKGRHATAPSRWMTITTTNDDDDDDEQRTTNDDDDREGKETHYIWLETSALPCCGTWRKRNECDDTVELDSDYDDDERRRKGREGKEPNKRRHDTSALLCSGKCPWRKRKACDDTVEFDDDDERRRTTIGKKRRRTGHGTRRRSDLPSCGKFSWRKRKACDDNVEFGWRLRRTTNDERRARREGDA
jgi:hypothetical protein